MKIVLSFYAGDTWLLVKLLEWMADLDGHLDYEAVLACDNQTDYGKVLDMAEALFCKVDLLTYNRPTRNQWPFPQNNSFTKVCQYMARQGEPWLWLETDCVPLCQGWLKILEAEYLKGKRPFGGHINKEGKINGVAIYPAHVARFSRKAVMAGLQIHPGTGAQPPWDMFASAEMLPLTHQMAHLLQHVWNLPGQTIEQAPVFPDKDSLKHLREGVVLFHRCKDGTLIDQMRHKLGKPANESSRRYFIHLVEQHKGSGSPRVRQNWTDFYRANNIIPFYYREPYGRMGFERNLPYLKDVLQQGLKLTDSPQAVFLLTNDDTLFHPDLLTVIEKHLTRMPFGCSFRMDINPGEPFPPPPIQIPMPNNRGHDLYFFQANFLKTVINTIPDFVLGTWKWDLILACQMRQWGNLAVDDASVHANSAVELPFGYVLHERHKAWWAQMENIRSQPSQQYNEKLYRDWLRLNAPALLRTQP